jgi:hypothetical protein
MLEGLPIDLIVEIGILAGPDEYEELAKTSDRNAIILQKPYMTRAMNELFVSYTETRYQGHLHSFNDLPAVISTYATKWYKYGELHRDNDQPAIIFPSGPRYWYQNGICQRLQNYSDFSKID